jgi:hypothetical protein
MRIDVAGEHRDELVGQVDDALGAVLGSLDLNLSGADVLHVPGEVELAT